MRTAGSGGISGGIANEVTTLARCMRIVRDDGVTARVTDHDQDINIPGEGAQASTILYDAPTTGGVQAASGIFSLSGGNPADTQTTTIGGVVYTFVSGALNATGKVKIGATVAITLQNLVQAIIAGTGAGVAYASGTTAHANVTASMLNAAAPVLAECTPITITAGAQFSNFTSGEAYAYDGVLTANTVNQPKTTDQTEGMWFGVHFAAQKRIAYAYVYPALNWHTHSDQDHPHSWPFGPGGFISSDNGQAMMLADGFTVS